MEITRQYRLATTARKKVRDINHNIHIYDIADIYYFLSSVNCPDILIINLYPVFLILERIIVEIWCLYSSPA
ncbi:hypothetical protein ACO02O_03891 [Dirofilaria immitis]